MVTRTTTILAAIGLGLAIAALLSLLLHGAVRPDVIAIAAVGALVVGVVVDRRTAASAELQRELVRRDRLATAGTVAAAVGHEIRTPLTVIAGAAEQLAARLETERELALVGDVDEATRQIEVVLGDLSSVTTPVEEPPAAVDLAAVVERAARLARYQLRHRSRVQIDPIEVPPVVGVPSRLVQVVLNLLTNAARAARPDADNPIRVRAAARGDRVVLEVADQGVGMDAATLARAGEAFFTTRRDHGGTGLGLAVCRSIVEAIGGTLEITSAPGAGTTVCVSLRAAATS